MTRSSSPVASVLIVGPTGSGKTPLGNYIERHGLKGSRCVHLDFGHELRCISDPPARPGVFSQSEISFIKDVLHEGIFLENEYYYIAEKVLHRFLRRNSMRNRDMLILNGIPRHVDQAKAMDGKIDVKKLIVLECSADVIRSRIQENTGNDQQGRSDDDTRMIEKKIALYEERTVPLIRYCALRGSTIHRMNVTASTTAEQLYSEFVSFIGALR